MSNGFDRIDAEDPTGIELLPHPTVQEWREFRAAVAAFVRRATSENARSERGQGRQYGAWKDDV